MYAISSNERLDPSVFATLEGIEYFLFEEDFVEAGMRCIPMIVRFRMDLAGIKLKLAEWVKFSVEEKVMLALRGTNTSLEILEYRKMLESMILKHTGKPATQLEVSLNPAWKDIQQIPAILVSRAEEFGFYLSIDQWQCLTDLQRFALLKLLKEGHENKNFPRALAEFEIFYTDKLKVNVC
ncbi:nitrate reductase associated protein [Pollutibacter soli]|uniref:nitrate reductase associated protein n=1 Tax=Pollutibacter soli TaxID=3034157 RepID=UPI003013FA89